MAKKKGRPKLTIPTNFWDAVIAFISKGMPVPFFIAIIIVVAIFRMPANEVAPFTLKALDKFTRDWLNLILIFLWLLTMVVCYYRNKIMQDELDRMAAVRDEAQRQSGSNIESSEA